MGGGAVGDPLALMEADASEEPAQLELGMEAA
jgi:hypothetical protein